MVWTASSRSIMQVGECLIYQHFGGRKWEISQHFVNFRETMQLKEDLMSYTGPTSILCVWVKKLMFSYALLKNHSQKTRPAFWGPVEKKMSTLQSYENHLFASIIIVAHGTDLWGPELELIHLKFLLKTYLWFFSGFSKFTYILGAGPCTERQA